MWVVSRFLSREQFVHTINGGPAGGLCFEVVLPLDKGVWTGTYEHDFAAAISLGVRQGDVCYDVGGYRGYMTGVMARAGAGRVLVFEPLEANWRALQRLIELNPAYTIEPYCLAAGSDDGIARFRVMSDPSMGKLALSLFQPDAAAASDIEVVQRSLDSLVRKDKFPPPNVIKIDVEGAEMEVLIGASNILKEFRPKLFIEIHTEELAENCLAFLKALRYCVHRLEERSDSRLPWHVVANPEG
jgi:FkbM family methyltransferase